MFRFRTHYARRFSPGIAQLNKYRHATGTFFINRCDQIIRDLKFIRNNFEYIAGVDTRDYFFASESIPCRCIFMTGRLPMLFPQLRLGEERERGFYSECFSVIVIERRERSFYSECFYLITIERRERIFYSECFSVIMIERRERSFYCECFFLITTDRRERSFYSECFSLIMIEQRERSFLI